MIRHVPSTTTPSDEFVHCGYLIALEMRLAKLKIFICINDWSIVLQENSQRRPSRVLGGIDTKAPDSETWAV